MSIRLRLTLLYSTIVALTIITFGSILYITQSREAFDSIRSDLVRQASFLANAGERRPGLGHCPGTGRTAGWHYLG